MMDIQTYTGKDIIPFLSTMNTWCAQHLCSYPYLYMPSTQQIINPSDVMYIDDAEALLVIAKNNDSIVSIATGIPLNSTYLTTYYFPPEIIDKFKANGYDPNKIWYMGYFLLTPEYRDDKQLILEIYQLFVKKMQQLGKTQVSYVNVIQPENHPLKPANYRYLEPWDDIISGFTHSGVTTDATWPTLQLDDSVKDETHEIIFWVKEI